MILMSMEVEAKAYCEDLSVIEELIKGLGAEYKEEIEQFDTYYNHPARDFAQTDEALRIRWVHEKAHLTYKGPKIDDITKTREEIAVEVEDGDHAKEILVKLGFSEVGTVRKIRKKYNFNEFVICMDKVDGLGSFVEMEAQCDSDDSEEVSRLTGNILRTLKEWGLEKIERKSYLELLLGT
jgi:adenylate cyclase class 2